MNISFDLDSTLIPYNNEFPIAPYPRWYRWCKVEPLRKGSPLLFRQLQAEGHVLHIYTTSYRSTFRIRLFAFLYGLQIQRIITQKENLKTLKKARVNASKYPPAFGFD